jgi:hypothetical protein
VIARLAHDTFAPDQLRESADGLSFLDDRLGS